MQTYCLWKELILVEPKSDKNVQLVDLVFLTFDYLCWHDLYDTDFEREMLFSYIFKLVR